VSGLISGMPSASGGFTFTVQVTDSASATASKQFTLSVAAGLAIVNPPTLPSASLGVPYADTFQGAGGTSPYRWAITAGTLPVGLSLEPSTGTLSGTPENSGEFEFTVSVTDSASLVASQLFNLTVATGLIIQTLSPLPGGATGSHYSETLVAAGGTAPYTWVVVAGELPSGLNLSPAGVLSGAPSVNGAFTFTVKVTDQTGATASAHFSLTIGAGLVISSGATLPPGTLNQTYSLTLAATGGTGVYTWSITTGTLAPGLALSGDVITGTPTAPGTFNFTAKVVDSAGLTATQTFSIIVNAPAPPVNIAGVPESSTASQQISFSLSLASGYPLEIDGSITISFEPDAVAPATDPAIQFSTGGTKFSFKIPANSTSAVPVAFQTGTVAGTITLSVALQAEGVDLPAPGPFLIAIPRSAPSITNVIVRKSSNGFQVQVTGFSTPRELTEADLTFTPVAGANLQTTSVTENLTAVAQQWYQSSASDPFGSQFVLILPFTATEGSIDAVASVTVTLKDSKGTSPAMSANF
jgi:hypothetical protein